MGLPGRPPDGHLVPVVCCGARREHRGVSLCGFRPPALALHAQE